MCIIILGVFPVIISLNLNDSEFVIVALGLSLQYCHKLPDVFNNYHYYLLNYASASHHPSFFA